MAHPSRLEGDLARFESHWFEDQPARHPRTLVIGMGGASSPAGMLAHLRSSETLDVIDTSNPDTISSTDFTGVNVIAASKSGTTIETITTLAWALSHGLSPRDLTVITDPGTHLSQLAESLGAKVFYGDPECGGRFSALTAFGLVPAIAAGWDRAALVASSFVDGASPEEIDTWFAEGAHASMVRDGVGWFALSSAPRAMTSMLWLEQLVAESTGKLGRGVVPVVAAGGETGPSVDSAVRDIFATHVRVAAMAWALEVDPFNQPDVEMSKRHVYSELKSLTGPEPSTSVSSEEMTTLETADYVALQVFGPLDIETQLDAARERLEQRFSRVTAGLGPRFLHSTGQLHKGGPAGVGAVQVIVHPRSTPERISGRGYSFHDLHAAQARGDARALREAGRTVITLGVEQLDELGAIFGV